MGQPISVTETPTTRPGVVRFELNRSLTGMGHERYRSRDAATGVRPVDELARRLFDHGGVESVHVYSNVVTVNLTEGHSSDGLKGVAENLFIYYSEGVTPAEP
jgi:Scaffold protein Nfu/NifU N terminal